MSVYRMADHVVGRDFFLVFITRVRQPGEWQIIKTIDFLFFQGRPGWVYNNLLVANFLNNYIRFNLVRFFFNMHEVFGMFLFILQAFFV